MDCALAGAEAETTKSSAIFFGWISQTKELLDLIKILHFLSSPDRGVVIGGPEYEKSPGETLIDSEMAGPISVKLSGIDEGNSVHILGQKNWRYDDSGVMTHD